MPADSTRPVWPFKHISILTPHTRGAWCKKINGHLKYFGRWRVPDPDDAWARAALRRYLAFASAQQDGAAPPPMPGDVTLDLLVNHWLTDRGEAVAKGELTALQFVKYKKLADGVKGLMGAQRAVASLGPGDMKRIRDSFSGGPAWVGSQVRWTRGMFNWGREYYGVMPRYGGMFSGPGKSAVRRARREFKPFAPREIRKIIKVATPAVRCFVLLGLNCGFGQSDCAKLPVAAVDLKRRMIHYPRGKTGVERRCPLWPETVTALRAYVRPNAMLPDLFFVTRFGRPYVSEKTHKDDAGQLVRASRTDSVLKEFVQAQELAAGGIKNRSEGLRASLQRTADRKAGRKVEMGEFKGKGFYVLRHMFRSVAEETGKTSAIRVIMGQSFSGLDDYYLHLKMGGFRDLKVVTEAVRRWVFGGAKRTS